MRNNTPRNNAAMMAAIRNALRIAGDRCNDLTDGLLNYGGCGAYALAAYNALCKLGLRPRIYSYGPMGSPFFRHVWLHVAGIGSVDSDMIGNRVLDQVGHRWTAQYLRDIVANPSMWNDEFPRSKIPAINSTVHETLTAIAA